MTAAELYALAYRMAQAADDAWQAELVSVYGRSAGDARYGLAGKATPTLKTLWEMKHQADEVLHDAAILQFEASR